MDKLLLSLHYNIYKIRLWTYLLRSKNLTLLWITCFLEFRVISQWNPHYWYHSHSNVTFLKFFIFYFMVFSNFIAWFIGLNFWMKHLYHIALQYTTFWQFLKEYLRTWSLQISIWKLTKVNSYNSNQLESLIIHEKIVINDDCLNILVV